MYLIHSTLASLSPPLTFSISIYLEAFLVNKIDHSPYHSVMTQNVITLEYKVKYLPWLPLVKLLGIQR